MGVDNFDVLSALNENLARKGNEALASLNNPELCFFHLRGFIGYTLQFLEKQHSIAPLSKADLNKTGADLHRIERLKQWGVPLSRQEERALHDIRKLGNV